MMPSDSNKYISFTSSQFAEEKEPPCKTTMLIRLMQLLKDWSVVALWTRCGGWITDDNKPHKKKCVNCKHYQQSVNHHRKSEVAKNHMNKCSNFRTAMNTMEQADWPDWHIHNKKGGRKQVATLSVGMSSTCQSLIKAFWFDLANNQSYLAYKHLLIN